MLFANSRSNAGGLAYPPLSDNIFLRAVHFPSNRLVGPSGREVPGARTLGYFITNEIVHTLVARELGIVKYWQLPEWKNEGYADLVANGGEFDFERRGSKCAKEIESLTRSARGFTCAIIFLLRTCWIGRE